MPGVTILNVIEKGGFNPLCLVAGFIFAFIALYGIYGVVALFIDYGFDFSLIILFAISAACVFVSYVALTNIQQPTYNEYQVIVDSTVKFEDFIARYEIVDQDGKIYTVIERGAQEND